MAITLTLDGITVTFNKFLDQKLPRTIITPTPQIEYSLFGTPLGSGGYFNSKYLWTINALITEEEETNLNIIYKEFERLRITLDDARITLEDTNQKVQERTDNLIHSPLIGTDIEEIGSYSSFYAQFTVWFTQSPEYSQTGRYKTVNFTMTEV
jgi:hypothetical protein